jgi:hypothetical protein
MEINFGVRRAELIELAFIDQSESYEVDMTGIFYDPKTKNFAILTASGCSCWEGEGEETQHATFDEVEKELLGLPDRQYRPTLAGAEQLLVEARTKLNSLTEKS